MARSAKSEAATPADGALAQLEQAKARLSKELSSSKADARLHFGSGVFVMILSAIVLTYLHMQPTADAALESRERALNSIRLQIRDSNAMVTVCRTQTDMLRERMELGPTDPASCSHWITVANQWMQRERELVEGGAEGASYFSSTWTNVYRTIVNLAFVFLLNFSAFAFFRSYTFKHREAQFLVNEITNLELKQAAMMLSSYNVEVPDIIIEGLMNSERNFIARKDEKFLVQNEPSSSSSGSNLLAALRDVLGGSGTG